MIDKMLLDILVCPLCKENVKPEGDYLVCARCSKRYPVKDDIPIMLADEAEALGAGKVNPEKELS